MSMNRPPRCEGPANYEREDIFVKLRFLSTVIGGIDKAIANAEMDEKDVWAISMLLRDIAEQVYPEWEGSTK